MTDDPTANSAPIVRPATARPRSAAASATAEPDPATDEELAAIERSLCCLPRFSSAAVDDEPRVGVRLSILRGRGPGYNFCGCPRWAEAEVDARLDALVQLMQNAGEWPALLVADGVSRPVDLPARLAAAGWIPTETERIMWTRIVPGVPHLDPALRLEAVTSRTAADYERLEREIFGLPADFAAQRTAGLSYSLSAGWLRAYVVRLHGAPVATARLAAGDGLGGIFGVGVMPQHRGRGLGSLVTAVATRAGLASGSKLVWLSVNELNYPALRIYQRLGFQPSFAWSRWVAAAG